jgi:DNA-binding Lrp family transcriptional regulator
MEAARHPFPVSSTARTIGEQKAKVKSISSSRDVFAVVEVRGSQELNERVMDQIQRLVGVRETSTPIALD